MTNRHISLRSVTLWAILYVATFVSPVFSSPVLAVTDRSDLSVAMKTLPLLSTKITGNATLAILFDPASPASRQEADGIKALLDTGAQTSDDLKLTGVLVPVDDLGKLAGSRIAILTDGLGAHYSAISAAAANDSVLTLSTDLGCVRANQCVLGIVSSPHVEIYYSRAAAEAAKISFGQVFTLLVKQI